MAKTVALSQCMIVKNEERNIEKALSWGQGIVCEQIVVDTGSTDRTVEIAERMGAKVYYFQWIDDFSAAKNFAIEKASGDWIAFLDADEYFSKEEAKKLLPVLQYLQNTKNHALVTGWLQLDSAGKIFAGGSMARIFKNIPGLRYQNRVHEELYLNGKRPLFVDGSRELAIFHTGYSGSVHAELDKAGRNLPLILKELEDKPDDYNMMGFLGDCYTLMERDSEAIYWFEKAVSLMPDRLGGSDGRSATTLLKLLSLYQKQENEEKALHIYQKAITQLPEEPDFDFLIGQYYARKEKYREGAYYLKRALDGLEQFGGAGRGMLLTGKLRAAWELLARCHYENGSLGECVNCSVALLKGTPFQMNTLILLLRAFKKDEENGAVVGRKAASVKPLVGFLGKLYDLGLEQDKTFVLEAAVQAEYAGLVNELQDI